MKPCEICGRPGQKHHIVFKSHGGLNFELNYAYLCAKHHTDGPEAVHNNRDMDMRLKIRLQRELERLFPDDDYHIDEVAAKIRKDRRRLTKRMEKVPHHCGNYRREDIITFLMGGKLYAEMLPVKRLTKNENPDDGFSFLEDEECFTWNGKN